MIKPNNKPSFSLGQVVATQAALKLLEQHEKTPSEFLKRHATCDWGEDLCDEDKKLNDAAVEDGSRILSSYKVGEEKLWIITEAADTHGNRSATTLLLSFEY